MGLLALPLLLLIYWIIDKIEAKQGEKQFKAYQEDKKRRGLKYYE